MLDNDPEALLARTGDIVKLEQRIAVACGISGLDEYQLWQLVEKGMLSYWQRGGKRKGLTKEDVVELKRGAKQEGGWYEDGRFIPIDEWLGRFQKWNA